MLKFALFDYFPQRYCRRESFEQRELDRRILDFKDGRKYATAWAVDAVAQTLSLMDLSSTVIAFIPASCQRTTICRYRRFSAALCKRVGAINGFDYITVNGHRRKKHRDSSLRSGNMLCYAHIDEDFFRGKQVLVFDDICTTGKSSQAFICRLEDIGASVRMALFLAKTKRF
ncbi:MAG: phosphoribosyltransferase [Bacteroidaceae bacterium]|nr:phosphoribosyltransferase [Bacteroidaceae bacterium]